MYSMKPFLLHAVSHKSYIVNNKERCYTQFASTNIVPHLERGHINEIISLTCNVRQIIHTK